MSNLLKKLYLLMVYALLYIPILVLVIFSVNKTRYSLIWHGFSTHWYHQLFSDKELWSASINSLVLGISVSFVATLMGLLSCIHLFINHQKAYRSLRSLLLLLIILPDVVFGVSLLIFFNVTQIPLGFTSLFITHTTFCLPFAILIIESRMNTLDRDLYYCALDLGATRFQAFIKLFVPLLWPAVLSAMLICFTLSFDDVVTSYFVAGAEFQILPLTIYSLVKSGVTPELNALCTITFLLSMVLVIISQRLTRKTI